MSGSEGGTRSGANYQGQVDLRGTSQVANQCTHSFEGGLKFEDVFEYAGVVDWRLPWSGAYGLGKPMFKRSIILLLLLVTPFAQAQAVLECAMMDLQTAAPCCCTDENQPSMKGHDASQSCCAVQIKAGDRQFVVSAAEPSTRLSAKAHWSDAPVVAILPTAPIVAVVAAVALLRKPSVSLDPLSAPLYLRTARLRL